MTVNDLFFHHLTFLPDAITCGGRRIFPKVSENDDVEDPMQETFERFMEEFQDAKITDWTLWRFNDGTIILTLELCKSNG